MDPELTKMDNLTGKNEWLNLSIKILPPVILAILSKLALSYKQSHKFSFLSSIVIVCLAACGSIVGYWISMWLGWTEYRMTLTIYFFGLFSDRLFEFLFSKTFLNGMFTMIQDWILNNLMFLFNSIKNKKNQ